MDCHLIFPLIRERGLWHEFHLSNQVETPEEFSSILMEKVKYSVEIPIFLK